MQRFGNRLLLLRDGRAAFHGGSNSAFQRHAVCRRAGDYFIHCATDVSSADSREHVGRPVLCGHGERASGAQRRCREGAPTGQRRSFRMEGNP